MSILFLWQYKTRENLKKLHDVRAKLALISDDERGDLEFFFHRLMFRSSFAYTLFGDKPMSFEDFFKEDCIWKHYMHAFVNIDYGLDLFAYQRGWRVWKKYESLFPLKKFIFVQQEPRDCKNTPAPLGYSTVILIRKDNFLSTLKKYSNDFKKVLGENFSPNEMLNNIHRDKSLFFDRELKKNSALLGILLGYGRENAWYFHELDRLRKKMLKEFSARDEYEMVRTRFVPFPLRRPNFDLQYPVYLPMFMCLPQSEETKALEQKYTKQRKKICEEYQKGDFLEITLLKLTEP